MQPPVAAVRFYFAATPPSFTESEVPRLDEPVLRSWLGPVSNRLPIRNPRFDIGLSLCCDSHGDGRLLSRRLQ